MGYIKEPAGVDFVIKSRPLTESEELAISNHIKKYKAKKTAAIQKVTRATIKTKQPAKSLA